MFGNMLLLKHNMIFYESDKNSIFTKYVLRRNNGIQFLSSGKKRTPSKHVNNDRSSNGTRSKNWGKNEDNTVRNVSGPSRS